MLRPAKRRVISLVLTTLALMILYIACYSQHSEASEEKAVLIDLMRQSGSGVADETHLLSPGVRQGLWPGLVYIMEAENISSPAPSGVMAGAPGVFIQSWRGFALNGNESHSLRVSVETLRPVEAMNIRKLIASNMTLEEIRTEMRREEGDVIHRGVLRIGVDIYRLGSISMVPEGNKTVLDADVTLPEFGSSQNSTITTIGHLNVSFSGEDAEVVSQGILLMKSGEYSGDYRVLLDSQHWDVGMMNGLGRSSMPRRTMTADQGHPFGPPDTH